MLLEKNLKIEGTFISKHGYDYDHIVHKENILKKSFETHCEIGQKLSQEYKKIYKKNILRIRQLGTNV